MWADEQQEHEQHQTNDDPGAAPRPNSLLAWSEFNERQRGTSSTFAAGCPGPTVIVAALTLGPQAELTQRFVHLASERWDIEQMHAAMHDGQARSRVLEACSGRLTDSFFKDARALLHSPTAFLALPRSAQVHRYTALAFGMIARAVAGVRQNLRAQHDGYPFRLWQLLGSDPRAAAVRIMDDRPCLRDGFGKKNLRAFPVG